jgi:hypothetical protein
MEDLSMHCGLTLGQIGSMQGRQTEKRGQYEEKREKGEGRGEENKRTFLLLPSYHWHLSLGYFI